MGNVYDVNSSCLRYIVPFKYSGAFEDAVSKVEAQQENKPNKQGDYQKHWERRKSTLDGPESDLYGYVRNEYRFENDTDVLAEQKTGCEWLFWKSAEAEGKKGKKVKELLYYPEPIKRDNSELPKAWNISVINLGLMIFRNGLGFVWYEIEVPKKGIDSNELKRFQNIIRELNRGDASVLWEKQISNVEPDFGVVLEEKPDNYRAYMIPFLLGYWVNDIVSYLNVTYLAERKNSYESMIKKSMQSVRGLPNVKISNENASNVVTCNLPDKAILFTYVSFGSRTAENDLENKYSLIFHITNGYKDSYHFSSEVKSEIKRPFDNAFWYATQEGAAYLSWPVADNKEVFDSLIPSKVRTDYFALYLKVLYQSFSLLVYAEKIQAEISAVNGKYLTEPLDKRITELFGEINLFLTKSMATSVSHIHHQSEFYVYLKNQLRVHDDVKSVTSGLNALDILQREQRQREESKRVQEAWQEEQRRDREAQEERAKREEREKKSDGKIQAIMGLFALLGISSALVDCFDFISKFDAENGDFWDLLCATQGWEIAFFVVIGIISIIAIVVSVKAIFDAFRNRD